MQRNHLLTRRSDVSRRWQRAFADGLRIGALDELRESGRAVGACARLAASASGDTHRRAPLLWIDFDLFAQKVDVLDPGAFTGRFESVVVLDPRPDMSRARQVFRGRARAYCHACASPVLLRRVADAVERGELWIGREWSARLAEALAKSGAPASVR